MTATSTATRYLKAAHIGAVATVLAIATVIFDLPDFLRGLSVGLLLVSLVVLLTRWGRDEYITGLWHTGASMAFVAVVVWSFFGPFVEGFLHGIRGVAPGSSISMEMSGLVAVAAFFAAFHVKWLRG